MQYTTAPPTNKLRPSAPSALPLPLLCVRACAPLLTLRLSVLGNLRCTSSLMRLSERMNDSDTEMRRSLAYLHAPPTGHRHLISHPHRGSIHCLPPPLGLVPLPADPPDLTYLSSLPG